jgi:hypothetical protein
MAAQMDKNLLGLTGDTVTMKTARGGYSEGPLMFKRRGVYYYVYTLRGNQNYVNAYMMSRKSPLDGFEKPAGNDIFLFSSVADNVWGPGHGNVFYDETSDDYIFVYLEYGDGGTTRRVYANRMEFNEDGTIKTLVPDVYGVGYLGENTEKRTNLALKAKFSASSVAEPRTSKVQIETQPNAPLADKASVMTAERTHSYAAGNAGDGRNADCWMAAADDATPWIVADLGESLHVDECKIAFVHPTEGQAWRLESSLDGNNWTPCAEQKSLKACSPHVAKVDGEVRYLRLTISEGAKGIWRFDIY